MKIHPMPVLAFLRFYVAMAFVGAASFWPVACSSMLLNTRTSLSPEPQVNQASANIRPVKSGIASFERESRSMEPAAALPSYPGVALSRGGAAGKDLRESGQTGVALRGSFRMERPVGYGKKRFDSSTRQTGIKSGHHHELASFEDLATRSGPTHGIRPVAMKPKALPSLRIVRSDPARNTPVLPLGSLLRDEPGSYLSSSVVGTSETQSLKSERRSFGRGFDSPRLHHHGGALVSTGGEGPMETAGKDSRKKDQNQTRQLLVAAGGLNSSLRDAGSLGHRNQPYLSKPSAGSGTTIPAGIRIEPSELTTQRALVNRHPNGPTSVGSVNAASDPGPKGPGHSRVTGWRDSHLRTLATSQARKCGVDVPLFHRLVGRESGWNPRAISSSGARGLTQLLPRYHSHPLLDIDDPLTNLSISACYLRRLIDRQRGNVRAALMDYVAGPWRKATSQATHAYAADILSLSGGNE